LALTGWLESRRGLVGQNARPLLQVD
jgi:hypothetical protein